MTLLARCSLAALVLCAACAPAAEGDGLLPAIDGKVYAFDGRKGMATREVVPVDGQSFHTAFRFTINEKPEKEWQINSICVIPAAIAKGDQLELSLWARSAAEGQVAKVRVMHQLNDKPWTATFSKVVEASGEWKQYAFTYTAKQDFTEKGSRFALFFGMEAPQALEVADISLVNRGPAEAAAKP